MRRRASGLLLLMAIGTVLAAAQAAGQPAGQAPAQPVVADEGAEGYRLGPGDVLQLNVLQQPEFDAQLTIRPDGSAVISRVGAIPLAGLTVGEAEALIGQRLRLFNPGIGEVSLTVLQYNALRIYVLGAVTSPGSYSFTTPPTLWGAIRAAGGPTEQANLGAVRLIHKEGALATTRTYDLSALLSGRGQLPDVVLQADDSIVVPGREGIMTVPAEAGVQVFGNVATPGIVPVAEPTRLVTVLMQAGSPLNDSKLDEVWWVHGEGQSRYRSTRVNVKLFLEDGSLAGNPLVYPGDTIRVPQHVPATWWRDGLYVVSAAAAVLIAVDRINNP